MTRRILPAVFILILLAMFHGGGKEVLARDDSMRCGSDLINLDETMYDVRRSCGDPHSIRDVGEKRQYRVHNKKRLGVEYVLYITEWIYERNDGIYVLTFEGSRLVRKEFIFD